MRDRRKRLLRDSPWLRDTMLVVKDMRDVRFELEPGKSGVSVHEALVEGVDFRDADLAHFSATGCEFRGCDFARARLKDNVTMSYSPQSIYRDCSFDRADMVGPRVGMFELGVARFERCSFRRTRISSWFSFSAEFIDCTFEGAVRSCTFHGRTPDGVGGGHLTPRADVNEFRGNDFTEADLAGCAFTGGIDMAAQRWPDDTDYVWIRDASAAIDRGRHAVGQSIADPDQRQQALVELKVMGRYADGQHEMYVRRSELARHCTPETVEILVAGLTSS
jgi:uncharacterized protein YjbI with pentapeptide repeats